MNPDTDIVSQIEGAPWFQSTQGPQVSFTVKALAGLIAPILIQLGIKTGIPTIDSFIDIACIIGFGGAALYGYVRAKKNASVQIQALASQVKSLGQIPRFK